MIILPLPALTDNYIWMLLDSTDQAWVVDPGEADPVLQALKTHHRHLQGILITHHHWDHTGGVEALISATAARVIGPADLPCPTLIPARPDTTLTLSGTFPSFQVLAIPGHTLDHLAYYTPGALFCGDTLFAAGCGRAFEGTPTQLYDSLQRLASLPPDTQVYCAHEYTVKNLSFACSIEPHHHELSERLQRVQALRDQDLPSLPSTLQEELDTNPFLRCHTPEMMKAVSEKAGTSFSDPLQVFTRLRAWKNHY